jgi:tetratricopeptide (TPR) repeat protein
LEWATEIGDANMIATALNMRGHLAWMVGQVPPMIGLSQAAGRQPATPGIRALAAQQEGRGHALVGEGDDTDRKLDDAAALTLEAASHADDEPPWIYFHNPDYLRLQRGLAYRYLGRHAAAIDLLTTGLAATPNDTRQSEWVGMYVFQLALAYHQSGDHAAASAVLAGVEQIAIATGSPRLTAHARHLRHQLDTGVSRSVSYFDLKK